MHSTTNRNRKSTRAAKLTALRAFIRAEGWQLERMEDAEGESDGIPRAVAEDQARDMRITEHVHALLRDKFGMYHRMRRAILIATAFRQLRGEEIAAWPGGWPKGRPRKGIRRAPDAFEE